METTNNSNEVLLEEPAVKRQVPELLRIFGIWAIIASAFTFLIQGINNWYSTERIYAFSGCIAVLVLVSYFCTLVLRDKKSGSILSVLAGFLSPALSAALGGVILATIQSPAKSDFMEKFFFFSSLDFIHAIPALLAGFSVLAMSLLNASAVTRKDQVIHGSLFFIAFNCLLLFPFRDSLLWFTANLMVLAIILRNPASLVKTFSNPTIESRLVSLIPFICLVVIQVRSLLLYHGQHSFSVASLLFITACFLHFLNLAKPAVNYIGKIDLLVKTGVMIAGYKLLCMGNDFLFNREYPTLAFQVATIICVLASEIFCAIYRSDSHKNGNSLILVAGSLAGSTVDMFTSSVLSIVVGAVLLANGTQQKNKSNFYCGIAALTLGVLQYISSLLNYIGDYYWLAFFILGVGSLIGSSMLHFHKERLIEKFSFLMKQQASENEEPVKI